MLSRRIMASVRKPGWSPSNTTITNEVHTSPSKDKPTKGKSGVSRDISAEDTLLVDLKNLNIQDITTSPTINQNRSLNTSSSSSSPKKVLNSIARAAKLLQDKELSKVVVLVGAGLSTNSGIPDFRTPGSGLYDNLQQYNIPYPQAIFDINYFHYDPYPFFALAKELYPSVNYRPNYNHYFLRLLHEQGRLHRLYTQNIDGLERLAGIPPSKLVESHGTFSHATCVTCKKKYKGDEIKAAIFNDEIPECQSCKGIVKPDIVFFGEDLPSSFYQYQKDMRQAELVLIMGTSLEVYPFAGIIEKSAPTVPRILFNMEVVGPFKRPSRSTDFTVKGDLTKNLELLVTQMNLQDDILKLLKDSESQEYADKFHVESKESDGSPGSVDPKTASCAIHTSTSPNVTETSSAKLENDCLDSVGSSIVSEEVSSVTDCSSLEEIKGEPPSVDENSVDENSESSDSVK